MLFACIAAACGGGGGGGSAPLPGGGGGGGGGGSTPTPHSSGSPGSTPTPAGSTPTPVTSATPSRTPTPAPTPTQGGGGTILPNTNGRFGLTQILDWNGITGNGEVKLTPSQIAQEAPHYDSVWGAFDPADWNAAHPGMLLSRYYLPNEDSYAISGRTLANWQQSNPSWVLYGCDQNNNPTQDLAWYGTYFHDVPLNIDNSQVVSYQLGSLVPFLQKNQYNMLAIDNVIFVNYGESPNPDLGEGSPQPHWYGCGVYNGPGFTNFQQVYKGGLDFADPTWIADMQNWVAQAHNALGAAGMHVMINHPLFDATPSPDEYQVLQNVDALVDENGFTHYDNYETPNNNYNVLALFTETLSWMEWAQSHGKAILLTDYYCQDGVNAHGGNCSGNNPPALNAQQADWALSTYSLGNNGGADVYISPGGGAVFSYRPEYSTSLGPPCSNIYSTAGGLYYRKFQNALVIVNPQQTGGGSPGQTLSFPLPTGHSYTDIEGRPVPNPPGPLSLTAPDGYVLLTTNGCS